MIHAIPRLRRAALLLVVMASTLVACEREDRRLTEDRQTCSSMGHPSGSAESSECMKDLNDRRCAALNRKVVSGHAITLDCTRL